MSHTVRINLCLLAAMAVYSGCAGSGEASAEKPATPTTSEAVALAGGEAITREEVERDAAQALRENAQQRYDILVDQINRIAMEKLVNKEAASRGISVQELFTQEVAAQVTPPTEPEIQAFWAQVKNQAGGQPLEAIRDRVVQALTQQKRQMRSQEYYAKLRSTHGFELKLDPPRVDVPLPASEPSRGPAKAPVTMVEFSDFDCPYCKQSHTVVERILGEYGDKVRFVYRDFPLPMHQRALPAAEAARCAGEQGKYWEYYKNLMEAQGDLTDEGLKKRATDTGLDVEAFSTCVQSRRFQDVVTRSIEEGKTLGITGTPSFFINGRFIEGAPNYEGLKTVIDEELARKG